MSYSSKSDDLDKPLDTQEQTSDRQEASTSGQDAEYKEQHPFLMLSVILVLVCISANFIPSGVFERTVVDGRTLIDPESFQVVEKSYVGFTDFFLSFFEGFKQASGLMAMVLFVGGAFGVVKYIGLLEASINSLAGKLQHLHFLPMTLTLILSFGTLVSLTGMYELSIVLVPLIVPLYLRFGYDVIVGTAVVLVGACAGLGAGMTNPFFTAIAQNIAELPLYSGILFRMATFLILALIGLVYIYFYAKKIKSDPERSITHGLPVKFDEVESLSSKMSPALKRAAIVFLGMFAFLVYGSINLGFSFSQMSATFIAMAIFVGLAYGAGPNRICHMFARGMSEMMIAAMVIFFARSILFVMEESQVIDTVINYLAGLIGGVSGQAGATLILLVQTVINFLVPSGSGQAAITMPIIIPLSDIMEVNRQVAILASQLGDGMSNFIFPTNGALIAILSVAGIPYLKWLRFFGPLYLVLFATAITLVSTASMIGYGPF
ncbi:YfcC family protein [Chromohalobacter israelensis]|uniref:YfcC family protein n=1 Tax=Chromohalobacter israelensis TaxID=141390 RepID=UPI000FFE3DD9|nr:Na+/H+ antiporter NhaC family protein [Chromohalobacter salexigens]RXE48138.1 hypothetical protein B4O83_09180 [Chromohalobacter salexigens]